MLIYWTCWGKLCKILYSCWEFYDLFFSLDFDERFLEEGFKDF